jgi:hypothetical protein
MKNKTENKTVTHRLQPIGLYHTYETVDQLQEYIEQLSGDERALAFIIMGLTWNTCAHLTAEVAE